MRLKEGPVCRVRICRATFSTLAIQSSAAQIEPMMMPRKLQSGPFAERARRSMREIVIAVVLTCAALVFVVSALQGKGSEKTTMATSDKSENSAN